MQTFLQLRDFLWHHKAQMAAFNDTILHLWNIAKHMDTEFFLHKSFHSWIKHRGHLIKNHPFDITVLFVFQKAFYICSQRDTHSSAVHDQNHRSLSDPGQVIGTCLCGSTCYTVIKTHYPFHHCDLTICTVFDKKVSGNFLSCEKGVQIPGFGSDHLAMEHGINIIWPTLKRGSLYPTIYQHLQNSAGNQGFSTSTGTCAKQDPWYFCVHKITFLHRFLTVFPVGTDK